ncbi:phytoene desaturase family protein [Cytobacillus dafuensis]|uniref:NAD(P)/FAD-dependent oxidoreductase n=1 Tax=Cytobacillus dafuensis TaxID=1742359 RepID=A0A5B8Z1X7_CYTDA|nr:NAD(P)/FAD-dependent oxidoreductase [Cytobacillus dafuensis]QED47032.1 NAD(P)/FAD-dependent oxidoreductase [Cytobacillus dafuensis]
MYDVIIIGSGLGSLIAACKLALEGKKIIVLEKHTIAGGFATSFKRKRKWEFDVSLHCISGLKEGGRVRKILEEIGVYNRLEFQQASQLYTVIHPEGKMSIDGDTEQYKRKLIETFPEEEKGISEIFTLFVTIRNEMIDNQKGAPTFLKYQNYSLQEMLDEYIQSPQLKSIICQFWGYFGLSPSKLSANYFAYAWTDYHHYGGFYPRGRSQSISNELVSLLEEHGGNVITRQEVTEIIVENGKACGVRTKKGKEFRGEHIISNMDPKKMLSLISGVEEIPKRFAEKVTSIQPSYSCIQAYIIIDGIFSELFDENNHEIFVNDYFDLNRVEQDINEGNYGEMPYCVTIYENIVPEYQNNFESTLTMMQICSHKDWDNLNKEQYLQKKQNIANIYLDRLEKVYPGIKEKVKHIELATPLTVKRYTGHTDGAIYGAAQTVNQSLHRSLPQLTPIPHLYLVGAWTRPGAGYSGVISSGYNLANTILAREKREVHS